MESIGKKLKKYRKEIGLTQLQVAEKANISRSHYASLESDKYNPSLDTLTNIANVLNIDTTLLLGESDNKVVKIENKSKELILSDNEQSLLDDYRLLNTDGQKEANKRVKELTLIPFYKENNVVTLAAHNDHLNDADEKEKIMEDFDDMDKW